MPDDYICPITAEIMTDPVTTLDGFTYEREAITEWLRKKDTSPTTGATLESKKLIPNHSLRSIIRRFTEERTVALAPPPPNTATTCAALHSALPVAAVRPYCSSGCSSGR